jgi:rfaE bifunctional protein nucleotidyltransferase chain/domain
MQAPGSTGVRWAGEAASDLAFFPSRVILPRGGGDVFPRGQPMSRSKIADLDTLLAQRALWRVGGKQVVWTNGCFDILHVGHVRSLQEARSLGDVLVVGVNSDASVRKLKGASRPIVPEAERAELLAALACVDRVLIFGEDTPTEMLARLQPDIHCKGADYAPPSTRPIPEAEVVRAYGGRVAFLTFTPGVSTTDIVRRIEQSVRGER